MKRSISFYRDKLSFMTDEKGDSPEVIFFNTPGTKFELYPIDLLALDINSNNPPQIASGFSGVTLAYNVQKKEDVDKIIELARDAGAYIAKEPQNAFWGGYHAYFSDLDGYFWEVVWGPNFKFDSDGMLIL